MTPTSPNTGPTTWPDPAWWAPALALHERGTDRGHAAASAAADVPAALAARVPRPAWVDTAERVVRAAEPVTDLAELGETWRDAFGRVLAPFVADAAERIAAAAPEHPALPGVSSALRHSLVAQAVRTLVTELHAWRAAGRLIGGDGRARFRDFARVIASPAGLTELFCRYPVLARLLAQTTDATVAATLELLARLAEDRAMIVSDLLGGTDPGPVTAIVPGRGDRHNGGRSVAFIDFADGSRIVYKPRDVTTQVRVGRFLGLLAEVLPGQCPRAVTTLARPGYGWSEFAPARELTGPAGADRFYRRQGALLAVLHLLRATDMHYENVIAEGDVPVLIDTETLFNAELTAGTGDPATDMLSSSVYRTSLLPLMVVGEQGVADLSGLGGDRGGASPTSVVDWLDAGTDRMRITRRELVMTGSANRPRVGGADLDPVDHEQALLTGFRQAYDAITAHAADFAALIRACADLEVRVVARPSWVYATLLDETTHPDVLRDGLDRDEALSVLYAGRAGHPLFGRLVTHELAAMWDGDVPMFLACAGTGELRSPNGTPLPVALPKAGVTAALETLAGMGEVDRHAQEWIISATLATRGGSHAHPRAGALPGVSANSVVHPDVLVTAARAMADRIVAHAAGGEHVNWLGLEHVDGQWLVLPMGASLGTGYLGVALFLAQLAEVTGIGRYAEQAARVVADAPAFTDAFAARPELAEAAGWGGLTGLGGITYALARLGRLLDTPVLRDCAAHLTELAAKSAGSTTELGWASGLAGCLAAMTAVHTDLGVDTAATVARECADRLADLVDQDAGTRPLSFADGLAGAAWALRTAGPDAVHRDAGRRAAALVAARATATSGGWCEGGPGLALAASCAPDQVSAADIVAMADGPVRRDLSLCHGELGVLEVLTTLAGTDPYRELAARALSRRIGPVLELLRRHGPVCGTPGSTPTPGLLTGFAGIGYGMLRLAAPRDVPPVLLLRPEER
ncbi:type 2 lanthipeptide synthetase LanM family protein [Actinophytocola sp. NPDC049390]|uniref:type 2 lanthipeptide synthetase LanM family protein n=1 Tax=Actinophytocola sp. NPDC049390 TaxID=3363894 RepID=UPI0037944EE6